MQKVILSGGNGFIGSTLVKRLLESKVEVHALVNENHQRLNEILPRECIHELREGVSTAVQIVKSVQPDTIFHLAAVYAEPVSANCVLSMIEGNLTLGACLLFAATQCTSQPVFVNTGTYWQFGQGGSYSPNTLYAATKHAFQDLLHFYRERYAVRSTTLVLYDTFGERDNRPKLWRRMMSSAPGSALDLSEGEQTIHLVHIDDVVDAFRRAAELLHDKTPLAEIYSVASARPCSLRSLVEQVNQEAGLTLDLRWGRVPYWEGQVLTPWVGEQLPGWQTQVEVLPALVEMARQCQTEGHPA